MAAAIVLPSSPAQAAVTGAGFVWLDDATPPTPYTPPWPFNYNSTDTNDPINTVVRSVDATGPLYTIAFPNLGLLGGTAHVTAYGSGTVACQVQSWSPSGSAQHVRVRCFNAAGTAVNSRFSVTFTNRTSPVSGELGYLWANNSGAASYTPTLAYQANSSGANNTITRVGTGVYSVHLPGLGVHGGHVQVTPYGSTPRRCVVSGWGNNAGTQDITVRCFNYAGSAADAQFTLTHVHETNILGLKLCCSDDGHETAYAWAHGHTAAAPYTPSSTYEFSSMSPFATPTATRIAQGRYAITWHPWIWQNWGNVQVTAYSGVSANCKVNYWNNDDGIRVDCYNSGGSLTDTMFNVTFTGTWTLKVP